METQQDDRTLKLKWTNNILPADIRRMLKGLVRKRRMNGRNCTTKMTDCTGIQTREINDINCPVSSVVHKHFLDDIGDLDD